MTTKSLPQSVLNHDRTSRSTVDSVGQRNLARGSHPTYAGAFRCIGPQCEDMCCGGWDIPVDKITYQRYRQLPEEKLGSLVAHFVSESSVKKHDSLYAYIHPKQDGSCPFLGADKLCELQKQYGPQMLTSTCSLYPRSLAMVDGTLEGSLSLSCPEAARVVLLQEDSTQREANLLSGEFRTDNFFHVANHAGLEELLLPIRALIADMIGDRSRPVWQRLLVICSLCSRLDDLAEGDLRSASELIAQYRDAVGQGSSAEMEQLEPEIATRLEMTIALSNQRCADRDCGQRFRDVFWDFIEGIGSTGSEGPDEDIRRFTEASRKYVEPLLSRSPFITENYLRNYVYQRLFPFGRAGSERFIAHTMYEEAVLLVIQFSWMTTLLTGVAGRYGEEFGHAQLITTVQSFTRAVEHVPQVLEDALAFVKCRNLDTLAGLAKLLRT